MRAGELILTMEHLEVSWAVSFMWALTLTEWLQETDLHERGFVKPWREKPDVGSIQLMLLLLIIY